MLILGIIIGICFTLILGLCASASDNDARIETLNEADRARREKQS